MSAPEQYKLGEWEHAWLKAFAQAIAECYAAKAALGEAQVHVAECEGALMVARAKLLAAESRDDLAEKLGDLAEEQAIKVGDRAALHIAGARVDGRDGE